MNEDKFKFSTKYRPKRGGSSTSQDHEVEANSVGAAHRTLPYGHTVKGGTLNLSTAAGKAQNKKYTDFSKNQSGHDSKRIEVFTPAQKAEATANRKRDEEELKRRREVKEDCSPLDKKIELPAFPKTAALLQKRREEECAKKKKVKQEPMVEATAAGVDRIQRAQHSHAVSMGLSHKLTDALRTFKNDVAKIHASGGSKAMQQMKISRLNARIASLRKKNTGRDAVVGRQFARIKE